MSAYHEIPHEIPPELLDIPPEEAPQPLDNFEQYNLYFEQCLAQNQINHNQFNHLMSVFLDCQDKFDAKELNQVMSDLKLSKGYQNFKNTQVQMQQEMADQQTMLQDMIRDGTIELQKFEAQLSEIRQEFEISSQRFQGLERRIERYQAWDNPTLNAELDEAREDMDASQSLLIQAQEDYDHKEAEVQGWANQLN